MMKKPKIRFKGFTETWEQRKIGDFSVESCVKGGTGLTAKKLTVKLHNNGVVKTDEKIKGSDSTQYYVRYAGQLIYGKQNFFNGAIGIVPETLDKYESTKDVPSFDVDDNVDVGWLYHYLARTEIYKAQEVLCTGTGSKRFHVNNFLNMKLYMPLKKEQKLIESYIYQLDNLITLHQRKCDELKKLKKFMLQKLFPQNGKNIPEIRFSGFTDTWEQRKLSEEFEKFIVPMRDKPKEFGGNTPWTRIEDIEGKYLNDSLSGKYVTEETIKNMNLKIIPKDSLIVSSSATFGVVAIVKRDLITNQTFIGLVPNDKEELDYWYAFFYSNEARKYMQSQSAGSTIFYIARESFENMPIRVPTKNEKIEIGEYFHNLDHLITLHQCKYFNQFVFNLFAWEQRKLEKVFDLLQNNTLSRNELVEENGKALNIHYGDILIKYGDILDISKAKITMIKDCSVLDKYKSSYLMNGDIIIADTAEDDTVGKCTEIQGITNQITISGLHTIPCRPKEKFGVGYLGYYLNSNAYHMQLRPLMQGIKVTSISKSALKNTIISYPKELDEQQKIGSYFSKLDNLITLHQRKCDELKSIKKYMLQNMFV